MIQSPGTEVGQSVVARLRSRAPAPAPDQGQVDQLVDTGMLVRLAALASGARLETSPGAGGVHFSLQAPALDRPLSDKGAALHWTGEASGWKGVTEVYTCHAGGGGSELYQTPETPYDFHTASGNPILFFDRTVEIRSMDGQEYLRLKFPQADPTTQTRATYQPESIEIGARGHALRADLGPSNSLHLQGSDVVPVAGPTGNQDGMGYAYYFEHADLDQGRATYQSGGLVSSQRDFTEPKSTHVSIPNPTPFSVLADAKRDLLTALTHFEPES